MNYGSLNEANTKHLPKEEINDQRNHSFWMGHRPILWCFLWVFLQPYPLHRAAFLKTGVTIPGSTQSRLSAKIFLLLLGKKKKPPVPGSLWNSSYTTVSKQFSGTKGTPAPIRGRAFEGLFSLQGRPNHCNWFKPRNSRFGFFLFIIIIFFPEKREFWLSANGTGEHSIVIATFLASASCDLFVSSLVLTE